MLVKISDSYLCLGGFEAIRICNVPLYEFSYTKSCRKLSVFFTNPVFGNTSVSMVFSIWTFTYLFGMRIATSKAENFVESSESFFAFHI